MSFQHIGFACMIQCAKCSCVAYDIENNSNVIRWTLSFSGNKFFIIKTNRYKYSSVSAKKKSNNFTIFGVVAEFR